jgi:HD superfamily phosphohydrolase
MTPLVILRDPVHGLISFEGEVQNVVARLMDTREVQRLRRIRALGHASFAFPGAEHSRFAHAVGSAHVMQRYLDRVRRLASDIPASDRIDDDMARVALAAALLHDVGHGPFSHTFEAVLPDARAHEEWTSSIILDPDTEVHAVLHAIDPQVPALVERLVHGKSPIRHLARAVSGTFDVDRCDYLLRDSYMTGVRYGLLDLDWLLAALRLYLPDGDHAAALAVDGEKGLTAVEGFFLNRLYMYRQVYLHKAVRAADAVSRALFRRLRDDPVLSDLARRQRDRRLFKSLQLRPEVPQLQAQERLDQVLRAGGHAPEYAGGIDRVEIDAYIEDEALMVLGSRGRPERLLDASPVMHGLSRETFVHYRALFPEAMRDAVSEALAELR